MIFVRFKNYLILKDGWWFEGLTPFPTSYHRCLAWKVFECGLIGGVDTFVQGTVVQGPLCPKDISPRRLLSKETLVQGDYCPR